MSMVTGAVETPSVRPLEAMLAGVMALGAIGAPVALSLVELEYTTAAPTTRMATIPKTAVHRSSGSIPPPARRVDGGEGRVEDWAALIDARLRDRFDISSPQRRPASRA
jgi:hypothetical protein